MRQKEILANFMANHPDLAKNRLTNCSQALWRKVFADQKHNAKKKLSLNKFSKNQTGGGPYEEKTLTYAEELIVEAAGITPAVEGLEKVKTFGGVADQNEVSETEKENELEPHSSNKRRRHSAVKEDPKLTILQENIDKSEEWHQDISTKLDKLTL